MYKQDFKDANDTIKMDEHLKKNIVSVMQKEQERKNYRSFRYGRTVVIMAAAIAVISVITVGAVSLKNNNGFGNIFSKDKAGLLNNNKTEIAESDVNFISDGELNEMGQEVSLKGESGDIKYHVTRLLADKYSLYGIIEISYPENIDINKEHDITFGNHFSLTTMLEPWKSDINGKLNISETGYNTALLYGQQLPTDSKEHYLRYVFGIDTMAYENFNNPGADEEDYFSGKLLSVQLSTDCENQNCKEFCAKTVELEEMVKIKLPEKIEKIKDSIIFKDKYRVMGDYHVYNGSDDSEEETLYPKYSNVNISDIIVTPFSIRYKFEPTKDSSIVLPKIIFKNGETLKAVDYSINSSDEKENKNTCIFGCTLPQPVKLSQIKEIEIGNKRISVK